MPTRLGSTETPVFEAKDIRSTRDIALDCMFSPEYEGMVPYQVTLLTGASGLGKTTVAMNMAAGLIKDGRKVVFVSLEMSDFQLKATAARVPGSDDVLITTDTDIDDIFDSVLTHSVDVVIIDSWQYLLEAYQIANKTSNGEQDSSFLIKRITSFARQNFVNFIIIGHTKKNGDYKGSTALKHDVDSHFNLRKDDRGIYIEPEKNRLGDINLVVRIFWMSSRMYFNLERGTNRQIFLIENGDLTSFSNEQEVAIRYKTSASTVKKWLNQGYTSDSKVIYYAVMNL